MKTLDFNKMTEQEAKQTLEQLTDQAELVRAAKELPNGDLRIKAIYKITDENSLLEIINGNEADYLTTRTATYETEEYGEMTDYHGDTIGGNYTKINKYQKPVDLRQEAEIRRGELYASKQFIEIEAEAKKGNYMLGSPHTQVFLGDCYAWQVTTLEELLVPKPYFETAMYWYKQAVENGSAYAMHGLATSYWNLHFRGIAAGKPNPSATANAKEYEEKAKENGYKEGAETPHGKIFFEKGLWYYTNAAVPKPYAIAHLFIKIAARHNYAPALYKLGALYESGGEGIEEDIKKALKYYEDAARIGCADASEAVKRLRG